jgi:hypothetical protein
MLSLLHQQISNTAIHLSLRDEPKRKHIDLGGKLWEEEVHVLNVKLKRYGFDSSMQLLRDFKSNGSVSLMNGKANPEFF